MECPVFFLGEFKVPSKPAAVDGRAVTFGVLILVRVALCGTEAACKSERGSRREVKTTLLHLHLIWCKRNWRE